MNQDERGQENLQNINDRNSVERDENRVDRGDKANGEAAGGTHQDVPGGAYNVPPDAADEVSDAPARDTQNANR